MTDRADSVFRTRRFAEDVVTIVREMILGGEYEPGERINEIKLAEKLSISRSPVREALQLLAGEGLVRMVAGRGAYVATFDVASIGYLAEVREALECAAARHAAARASEESLDQLELFLVRTKDALGDSGLPYPRDLDFHQQLLDMTGNPRLVESAREVALQLQLAQARSGERPGRAQAAYDEHVRIYEALRNHDGDAAAAAMADHLACAKAHVLQLLEADGAAASPASAQRGDTASEEGL